ncbi:pyrroloquinoline quinone biosynthesis protein PqqB, partial [Streptomyces sp. A7024]
APQPLAPGSSVEISAIGVSGKRPRYAADAKQAGNWVSALDAVDRATGRRLLYAPALGVWPEWLDGAAAAADCVLMDGTFWDDQEPVRAGFTERTATAMGHLPITGPGGTAERLAALDVPRRLYTHLNNTNPLTAPGAAEHQLLDAHGLEVAHDGMVLQL